MQVSRKPIFLPFQYNTRKRFHYTVKVINPGCKSDYKVETLKSGRFTSTEDVRDQLSDLLKCQVTDVGYIEPGHGLKGKQQTLIDDDDIDEMYDVYKGRDVALLCDAAHGGAACRSKKRTSLDRKIKPHDPNKRTLLLKNYLKLSLL